MQRLIIALGIGCLVLTGLAACGPSEEEIEAQADEQHRQLLADLESQQQELRAKRQELRDLEARLEARLEGGPEEDDGAGDGEGDAAEAEVEAAGEDLEARIQQLQTQVNDAAEDFYNAIGTFLNDEVPMLQGEEPTEIQKSALRMKSSEDMLLAREYIEKGGDYKRAINIYQQALLVDPDNPELQAALAEAQGNRFMTEERFSQVKNGMNEGEVREVLGPPNLYNVKEYPDQDVTAWYYPKNEQGAAAAVFFRPRGGELRVYKIDFEATPGRTDEEA